MTTTPTTRTLTQPRRLKSETPWQSVAGRPSAQWGTDVVVEDVLGAPCKVFVPRPVHLDQLLAEAGRHGRRAHLVAGEQRLGFDQLESAVERVAAHLTAQGLAPGDAVLLLGANSIPWIVAFWAALRSGWVLVPGNAWWSAEEVAHAAGTVGVRLAIVDGRRRGRLPAGLRVVALETLLDESPEPSASPPPSGRERRDSEDDPALVLFTSGTTSVPKGATLTHRSLLANLHNLLVVGQRLPGTPGASKAPSVTLMTLPLFHIGGIQQLLTAVVGGATLVLFEGRFDGRTAASVMEREGVTVWAAVPTMLTRLLEVVEADPGAYDLSSLKTLILGGSPVPDALLDQVAAVLPNVSRGLGVSYGLTEVSGVLATATGAVVAGKPGAVGRLLPTVEARIDAPDGDGVGELLVRTPGLMQGYWGDGDREDVISADRWFRTGDLGHLDDDLLFIVGRSKDVVIRGGENVASSRVEERLLQHPAVAEAMVLSLPHPELGEEVAAAVVLRAGYAAGQAELAAFAAETLAYFEVPTAWWLRDSLPANATGKPLKRQVLDEWKNRVSGDR
jgi:steroid-24-oyl-CoA synthetase